MNDEDRRLIEALVSLTCLGLFAWLALIAYWVSG